MMMKSTLALLTMLGHATSATSLRELAQQRGGVYRDPRSISEAEFLETDKQQLVAIMETARAGKEEADNKYARVTKQADAEITRLNGKLVQLDTADRHLQGTLTMIAYKASVEKQINEPRRTLEAEIRAQERIKVDAEQQRKAETRRAMDQCKSDTQASKIQAVRNVAINNPERAQQILTSIFQARKQRDQGNCGKVVAGTTFGAVAGAAVAGGLGFGAAYGLGECGYCVAHCDTGGTTDAGYAAAGQACGKPAGAVTGIGGGLFGGAQGMAVTWPAKHGYTREEQSLIDLMSASDEARKFFENYQRY